MFGNTWSHDVIKKYVAYFGTLFNDMYLTRDLNTGETTQTIKVPLSYGPKEKFLARATGNPDLNRPIAIDLPRMSFELMSLEYSPSRKLNKMNKITKQKTGAKDQVKYEFIPVPYDLIFNLYIMVKNVEDGTKLIEQILPNFTPDFTATLELVPEVSGTYDTPVVLNSVSSEDTYEGDFQTRRALIWTLSFTLSGYIFGPSKDKKLIKFATTNLKVTSDPQNAPANTKNSAVIYTYPGLLANGSPTTNSELTIAYTLISADDDYGFVHEIHEDL